MPHQYLKNCDTGEVVSSYIPPTTEELVSLAKSRRDQLLARGTGTVQTDLDSVTNLMGALKTAELTGQTIRWRLGNGVWADCDLATLKDIAITQGQYIQKIQDRYTMLRELIKSDVPVQQIEALIEEEWVPTP